MAATTATTGALTFRAQEHIEDGVYWANSEQLPNWTAVADSHDELFQLVAESPAVHMDWPEGGYNVVLWKVGSTP